MLAIFGVVFIISCLAFIIVNLIRKRIVRYKRRKVILEKLAVYKNKEIPWGDKNACIDIGKRAFECRVAYWQGIPEMQETKWWAEGWLSAYNCNPCVHPMVNDNMNSTTEIPEGMFEPESFKIIQELKGKDEKTST